VIATSNMTGWDYDVVQVVNESPVNRRGGVATVAAALHQVLLERGINSLFAVVDHMHTRQEIQQTLDRLPHTVFAGSDQLSQFRAPIVHCHAYRYGPDLLEHARKVPTLATLHSIAAAESSGLPAAYGDDVAGQIALIGAAAAVALVSVAEHDRYLRLAYADINPHATVIYNGIVAPKSIPARDYSRRERLGYCGRMVARKNPDYVLRALTEPRFSSARAILAGRPFTPSLERWLAVPGVADRVDLLGWCGGPRLERFFAEIDVLIVPSSYEPSGLVAMEASVRGVPVVCTRADGLVETMGDGAYYSAGDSYDDVLAAVKAWAAADDGALEAKTSAARERTLSLFSAEAMTTRYQAAYAEVGRQSSSE
jgi:glycosyltransferase involved in cell wall biosynthesis